jgi:hypothetical protein
MKGGDPTRPEVRGKEGAKRKGETVACRLQTVVRQIRTKNEKNARGDHLNLIIYLIFCMLRC